MHLTLGFILKCLRVREVPQSLKDFGQISLDQSKSISQTIWFQNPFNCLLDHMSTSGNDGYSLPSCRRGKFCIRLKTLCKLRRRRVSFLKLQWSEQVKNFNGRLRSKIKIILQISKQFYLEHAELFWLVLWWREPTGNKFSKRHTNLPSQGTQSRCSL